jgi:23S rRNA (cytidine1920-2'-O)/16S rRNA (cytidine1409-2'-O)-methyltransferase
MRLDQRLVELGYYQTRARASDAISRGAVSINGNMAKKAGQKVGNDADINVDDPASTYVSRAALKLKAGLEYYGFDVADKTAIDIGASTGGFTQVLLEQDAKHVIAVDVGHNQLHASLVNHPSITQYDGLNARELGIEYLTGHQIDIVVSDVSFISLKLALPPALSLAKSGAVAILLIKPQFEAGKDAIGKGGLLKDPTLAEKIAEDLRLWLDAQPNWSALDIIPSPILGGDGNREFLIGGVKI